MRAPTGEQFSLALESGSSRSRAIITEVAASLRVLEVEGVDIVDSYPEDRQPPYASGAVLAPWPNRIRDGAWVHNGESFQLDITDVAHHCAIHGLLRTRPYRVVDRAAHCITLAATIFAQHGYPFVVDTTVRYELTADGIEVTHGFTNASAVPAPVAAGAHPFVRVGALPIEELTLYLASETRYVVDSQLIPVDEVSVEGTEFDLRAGQTVGTLDLDTAFGRVTRGEDRLARHRLVAPDGSFTEVWQGQGFDFVQAFTPHTFPRPRPDAAGALGQAVAIEPMTAPPDAFNSGIGVRWLDPGEQWSGSWGIRYGRG